MATGCEAAEKTSGEIATATGMGWNGHSHDGAGRERAMKNASHDNVPSNIPALTV